MLGYLHPPDRGYLASTSSDWDGAMGCAFQRVDIADDEPAAEDFPSICQKLSAVT
jgi:hypothetical protein